MVVQAAESNPSEKCHQSGGRRTGESNPSEAPAAGVVGRWWLCGVDVVGGRRSGAPAAADEPGLREEPFRERLEPSGERAHAHNRNEPSQSRSRVGSADREAK